MQSMLPHLQDTLTSPTSYNAPGNQIYIYIYILALFGQDQFFGSDLSVETALCMYGPYMSLLFIFAYPDCGSCL